MKGRREDVRKEIRKGRREKPHQERRLCDFSVGRIVGCVREWMSRRANEWMRKEVRKDGSSEWKRNERKKDHSSERGTTKRKRERMKERTKLMIDLLFHLSVNYSFAHHSNNLSKTLRNYTIAFSSTALQCPSAALHHCVTSRYVAFHYITMASSCLLAFRLVWNDGRVAIRHPLLWFHEEAPSPPALFALRPSRRPMPSRHVTERDTPAATHTPAVDCHQLTCYSRTRRHLPIEGDGRRQRLHLPNERVDRSLRRSGRAAQGRGFQWSGSF